MTNNQQWQTRKTQALARGLGNMYPHFIAKARNAEVWDIEDNHFIDFGTGIAVCNTGHSHPKVVEAVKAQVDRFSHSCFMVNPYTDAVALAEQLNTLVPGPTPKKTVFATTGAEAVENAIKIARAHTGRRGVIAFNGGFHGRTNLAMALTGKVLPYKKDFGPFPADIYHAPYPTIYHGITSSDAMAALQTLFKTSISPADVAAIILEPIQGEGGFYAAPKEFLQSLRALCDEHGILLIIDEIQTGFARTGRFFYSEQSGVEADLMTLAKGIAGGFPLSAVVGKHNIMDTPEAGGLGGTYTAPPIACAAALAVLDVMKSEKLTERAIEIGAHFQERLQLIANQYPDHIGDIRTHGAMIALEFVSNNDPKKPNAALVKEIIAVAPEHGLILLPCGFYGNVIRFLPPLTIERETIELGLDRFEKLLDSIPSLK